MIPKQPDSAAAVDLLSRVQTNVVNMDSSGRQSMATFERGHRRRHRHL